jgi:hypothetical protein
VLYTGRTFETALLEVFGDQWIGSPVTGRDFLKEFDVCEIRLAYPLKVVNLGGKQLNLPGTEANIFASLSDYKRGRRGRLQLECRKTE